MTGELPRIITNTLDNHGYVAITKEEHERLLALPDPSPESCRYPLFFDPFSGPTHREYITTIEHHDGDPTHGVIVTRCSACGHVEYERNNPVAIG